MVAIWIIGAVLLLAAFLLLAPVSFDISFRGSFSGQARYLFFKFPLAGSREEEAPPGQEDVPREAEAPSEGLLKKLRAMLRREGLEGFLQSLKELAQAVKDSSGGLLRHTRLKSFDLYICLAGREDAAAAAVLYGQVCAVVYACCGALFHWRPGKRRRVSVDLDYQGEEHQVVFSGKASIRLLFLLKEGIILIWKALPFFKKLRLNQTERISQTRKQGETE